MRILQFCTNFRSGGIQRHVLDLTQDLRSEGHEVVLAGDSGDWQGAVEGADYVHVPMDRVVFTGGSLPRRLAAIPQCAGALRRALATRPVDLIHAHETGPVMIARLASLGRRIPIVMTFHGSSPAREAGAARTARLCADLIISPSRTSLDRLIAKGLPRERTRVVGLGIAPMPRLPAADVAAKRAALLDGKAGPLIFSLSRLQEQKGIDIMVEVARRVVARHPGAVFAVAGGGPDRARATGWAEAAGLAGHMRFLGPIGEVPLHLQASDIYLLTSRWEALPISIVEAFRARLPVVATDCGGVRELVDDSVGALLPVGDVDGLTEAVVALIEDAELRRAKGEAAEARSTEARFDPASVHAEFIETYRRVIDAGPAAAAAAR